MVEFTNLRAANIARHNEWTTADGAEVPISYRGNELAGEVGEVCNIIKKIDRERMGRVGSRATLDQLIEELADAYICLDLVQMDLGISEEQMQRGLAAKFNKTSTERGHKTTLKL